MIRSQDATAANRRDRYNQVMPGPQQKKKFTAKKGGLGEYRGQTWTVVLIFTILK